MVDFSKFGHIYIGVFSVQVPGPQATNDAERCITTSNNFFAMNDTCLNNFLTLSEASLPNEISATAFDICTSCRSRMTRYVTYLLDCRVYYDKNNDVCYVYKTTFWMLVVEYKCYPLYL